MAEERIAALEQKNVALYDQMTLESWTLRELNAAAEKMKTMEDKLDKNAKHREGHGCKLNYAVGKTLDPESWSNDNRAFKVFDAQVMTYFVALEDSSDIMIKVIKHAEELDIDKEPEEQRELFKTLNKELGLMLDNKVRGEPKAMIHGMNIRDGFKALQRLALFYEPRSDIDEAAALEPLQRPRQAKSIA